MWLLITFVIIWSLSPGPLTVVTLYESKKYGAKEGIAISSGATLTHAFIVLAALAIHDSGFTGIFEANSMQLIERIGAFGIIAMGIFAGRKSFVTQTKEADIKSLKPSKQLGFYKGMLLVATSIPQACIFYGLIVPNTVEPQTLIYTLLGLGLLKTLLVFGWHSVIALLTRQAETWLSKSYWGKLLERSAATMIIVFGVIILL